MLSADYWDHELVSPTGPVLRSYQRLLDDLPKRLRRLFSGYTVTTAREMR